MTKSRLLIGLLLFSSVVSGLVSIYSWAETTATQNTNTRKRAPKTAAQRGACYKDPSKVVPWLDPNAECPSPREDVQALSEGAPFIPGKGWEAKTRCTLTVMYCGGHFERVKDIVAGGKEKCFDPNDYRLKHQICCELFREAIRTKQPCDPSQNVDCDGRPNTEDPTPFGGAIGPDEQPPEIQDYVWASSPSGFASLNICHGTAPEGSGGYKIPSGTPLHVKKVFYVTRDGKQTWEISEYEVEGEKNGGGKFDCRIDPGEVSCTGVGMQQP